MRDFLDVQHTPVGLKADLPQCGQVLQRLADAEVARVIDGGFGTESPALLVILLDARVLVVNVQGWHDPVGDHPRPEAARRPFVDAAIKNQLHLAGTAQIEILPDHFFKKHPARHGPVQHLRKRELGLKD